MARTHYRNGDEIELLCGCNGCNPDMINGVLCHEHGCPDAWRDVEVDCFECGVSFYSGEKGAEICLSCQVDDWDDEDNWKGDDDDDDE